MDAFQVLNRSFVKAQGGKEKLELEIGINARGGDMAVIIS